MRVVRKETAHTFTRLPAGMAYRIALAAFISAASSQSELPTILESQRHSY